MPSGGRRNGAGRKQILDELQRFAIGAECEAIWQSSLEKNKEAAIEADTENRPKLSELQRYIQAIPLHQRQNFLGQWYNGDRENLPPDAEEYSQLQDDADSERRERAGLEGVEFDNAPLPILQRISFKVPLGPKSHSPIVMRVLESEQARHPNTKISARFVVSCWTEYRRGMRDEIQ
jgi:hypothetical protein